MLRSQGGQMLRLGGFIRLTALAFYIFSTYMTTFLAKVVGMPADQVLLSNLLALVFATAIAPLIGRICDRVGRRRTMQFAGLSLAVLIAPSYFLATQGSFGTALASQVVMAVGAVSANAVTAVLLSECFPTNMRYTSSGICYNVTYAVFGGTPYLATWLIKESVGKSLRRDEHVPA
ncbi:MFS transporter [Arthrobacter sp. I2-34]|uniref:MFS transporter n=1 Tax=Arthrobacter hankyongi TaxID=2904801 RepID=A0ABS9L3H7_9MICC|nr:MFS transporter [Arthrobacter hankyongi]MCG2621197.1 MFS transporter [Arthrobacter hankyongi]